MEPATETTDTQSRIRTIIARFATDKEAFARLGPGTRLKEDLGVSSINVVDIVLEVEDTFGITIDDEELRLVNNVGALEAVISTKLAVRR